MGLPARGTGPPQVSEGTREGDQPEAVTSRLSVSRGLQDEGLTGFMEELQAMAVEEVGMARGHSEHADWCGPWEREGQAPT